MVRRHRRRYGSKAKNCAGRAFDLPIWLVKRRDSAMAFSIKVNGNTHSVDVDGDTPLLWVLRDVLGMTGTKFGCGTALCGACTVHLDGVAIRSCITPISAAQGKQITTIEATTDG